MLAVQADNTPVGWFWVDTRHPAGVPDCAVLLGLEARDVEFEAVVLAAAERFVAMRGIGAIEEGQLRRRLVVEDPVVRFVLAFVERFPEFRLDYEVHLDNEGGLLGHLFFGAGEGITDRIVEAYLGDGPNWRQQLEFLDEHVDRWGEEVLTVIGTSFLWRLPFPGQPGYRLAGQLPVRLRALFDQVRPAGLTRP
ncbi:hypothetical protein [Kineosporia babensis]|uniref:Uncharacterized protein n=1 Tax=Kineosporia babensis TaxID=499548 RepID=A0A9X1SYK6_9ACTN|nr:hypothetical protein [Kineosporia babensis]MCD5317201.1 hypothetical protein [Kineosporia babensis]